MNKVKRTLAMLLVSAIVLTLMPAAQIEASANQIDRNIPLSDTIPAFKDPIAYQPSSVSGTEPAADIFINSPSGITYDTRVSYELVTAGKTGKTDTDIRPAVVRFTLENPGEHQVSFDYTVLSGSVEDRYLTGALSGTVSLSKDVPQKDIAIEITPFSDNPEERNIPNIPNAFWTGEQFFYLYCGNIQNSLFDGDTESLTVPVPVASEFGYAEVYENAVNTKLIDLNQVDGGTNGVYPVSESRELQLTAEIEGDVRKMLDAGVINHIHLPQGYFINESNENQIVTYRIKTGNEDWDIESVSHEISLAATGQTEFYSGEFVRDMPIYDVKLGPRDEANGIFNRLDFIFDYNGLTVSDAVYTCFLDETGHYLQYQVSFSDQSSPAVNGVFSAAGYHAHHGDEIPVIIEFSEPVYTDSIVFEVGGQAFSPMESAGTISQKVSFLYRIGDVALNTESFTINVTNIIGAVDLSGKAQESPETYITSVNIPFEPGCSFAYCAEPSVSLDQGTSRNMLAEISIPIKYEAQLSNWLLDGSRLREGNISTAVKARAITDEGIIDVPLAIQTDETRVIGLTGSFTAPENITGGDVFYALEIYLDTGSSYKLIDSLVTVYAVQPLILVETENDITIDYSNWPSGGNIFMNAGSGLSLGYFLNVDATWIDSEYFRWSSSDESIAQIDYNGAITLMGTGQVYFTLTVTNPLTEAEVPFRSHTLTVLESQDAYLYVPNGIKNQDLLIGSDAKISFSSNLPERNELYGGSETETAYTFTLYELNDDGTKSPHSSEVINVLAQAPLNSYTVPASLLTKASAKNRYGYILEISAEDMHTGTTLTTAVNIRMRQLPAKASLIRPGSVFILDDALDFTVEFDIENKTSETEYAITVTKNSEPTPVKMAGSPEAIEPVTVNIGEVEGSRLLDVYTVNLKAKNLSDEVWSYDSYCVYVYNRLAMRMLIDGFPAPGTLIMDYDLKDEEIIYNINFLNYRAMIGNELIRTVKIDDRAYAWSAIADRVHWQVEGESASLWFNNRRIGDNYNPALLPGTSLILRGDGAGSAVVSATHTLTGMTDTMNVTLQPLNDKLFLFRVYPGVSCQLVYTNGNNQEKTVAFSSEVGVYEESGIKGDVVIYPTDGAENIYDFSVINHSSLMANQNGASSFDLYPVNTVKLPPVNYNVSLELFDEDTGEPYTDDIIIRGGVYLNGKYQDKTTINEKMGNADQTVSADEKGRYRHSFRPSDFTDRLLGSDELRYVIEVGFPDDSHLPQYITIENDAIQTQKNSPLGVCLSQGIKALNVSSIQNNVIVLSQTLNIDGEEKSISDRILVGEKPESATLDMTVIVPRFSETYYTMIMLDSSDDPVAGSAAGEFIYAYPFSETVTLRLVCDVRNMLIFNGYSSKPGEIHRYYPCIRSTDWLRQIKLSKHIEVQNLLNMPDMSDSLTSGVYNSEGDLRKIHMSFWEMSGSSEEISFSEDKDAVKDALDMMKGYHINASSLGLEVQSTDDPLVYKGIIRFAVGSYSKDNPSGVFVASGEKTSFQFMPGVSDMKAMAKGTFLKKAKEEMNKNFHKTYGGGAYMECLVYYDIEESKWKISLIYGDFYLGGGGTYRRSYNGWVSFVPVTATFEFNMTAELGLTILNSQVRNETAYIPRIRPVFSIYGFGGVGFDYTFVAFKSGVYGFVEHEQNYLWYTDSNGLKMDGQQLKISGEVGVEFAIWLAFVKLSGKYELADYSKSWEYNDYNRIQGKIADNERERSKKGFLAPGRFSVSGDTYTLVPVVGNAVFEDRSYLKTYERFWGSSQSGRRMFALLSSEELTNIWANAYPNAMPQLSDDGEIMVYLSDMDSEDLSDTAVLFAVKDGTGTFSAEGTQINASDYPDSNPSLSGSKNGASAVWVRTHAEMGNEAGSEATMEDVINGLAASEVMAGIYKEGVFTATRLTDNDKPDLAPVTAATGNRAIAAWRSVTLGDLDNPFDFTSDDIMYSVYDGSDWSEEKCLYDGSIDSVRALNTAMLPDGTSAIVYQISEGDNDSEIICAVLGTDGEVLTNLKLTDNITEEMNPQITAVEFPDGQKRFILGWGSESETGEGSVQIVAVNGNGTLFPEFSLALTGSTYAAGYSNFRFIRGAAVLKALSLIWSEPEDVDKDGTYAYSIFGTKLLVSDEGVVSASGKQKLQGLSEGRALDCLDATAYPDTGKVQFLMLLTEQSDSSSVTTTVVEYKNLLTVEEPDYEYEDILPGLEMPVLFTVKNDGIDAIEHITIELGNQTVEYDYETLAPGEEKRYLVYHPVPDPLSNADFTVTAQFAETGDTEIQTGTLKLALPDVGIYQIDCTKRTGRARGFRVLLHNTAFADLNKDIHTVKLEVWDNPDFTEGSPLKALTVSDDDLDIINNSLLSLDVTLTEEDLQRLLDENGEIPEGGAWLIFRAVLTEDGNVIEDADISNDIDFANVYSLIEKNGKAVSLVSFTEAADGKTTVKVEAKNNSMKAIHNGNIIVTLRDENGNVLETQQTYNSADSSSLLSISGEESETASFLFNHTGYATDVTFTRVSGESTLLSVLNLTGVLFSFEPTVYEYHLQTYDLNQTVLTAVAENPASVISVTRDGVPVSVFSPIPMAYGTNAFAITVTTGQTTITYTVIVENNTLDEDTDEDTDEETDEDTDEDTDDTGDASDDSDAGSNDSSDYYSAELTIDDITKRDLAVSVRNGRAVVSLGSSAQEIFSGTSDTALDIPSIPGAEGYTLKVPALTLAGSYTGGAVTVSTELGSIRIPAGMMRGIENLEEKIAGINLDISDKSELSEDIQAAVGDRPMLSLTLTLDDEPIDWSNHNSPVTVMIPYTPTAAELANIEGIVIWYIDGNGKAVCIPNGHYDAGTMTFMTTHFSDYAVVYNPVRFHDVTEDAWYHKAVGFIAARGITYGTGNGKYSPEDMLTRGEFIVLTMRAYGIKLDENPTENFTDAGDTYYTGYLAAAKRLGISVGVGNNMFAPDKNITRQEMFSLLYNTLRAIKQLPKTNNSDETGRGKSITDFTDGDQIAYWAREAMEVLVRIGIVNGNSGKLTPTEMTTRAQMAQVLYNSTTLKHK